MPQMIARRPMYYAGSRKTGERFEAPTAIAMAFAAMGQAKYAEDEGEVKKRRYKRRDMRASQ